MKKTIIILSLLLATVSSIGQTSQIAPNYPKDTTVNKPIPPPTLTDSTNFISINSINQWLPTIQDKVSFKTYQEFMALLNDLVDTNRKKWQEQEAKKKK